MEKNKSSNTNSTLLLLFVISTIQFFINLASIMNRISYEQSNLKDVDLSILWIIFETEKSYFKMFNTLGVLVVITIVTSLIKLLRDIDWKRF